MRLLIILVACAGLSACGSPAQADERQDKLCTSLGSLSRSIMNARQQGVAMSEVLATIQTDDPDLKSLLRTLIVAAYEKPRFLTDENRENAVADFRNETELACWKGTP